MCTNISRRWPGIGSSEQLASKWKQKWQLGEEPAQLPLEFLVMLKKYTGGNSMEGTEGELSALFLGRVVENCEHLLSGHFMSYVGMSLLLRLTGVA